MTSRGNNGEGRDGSASPEKYMNGGDDSSKIVKKKRPRVGDMRKSFTGGNVDKNPYQSDSDGYGNQQRRSYGNNNGGYNNNRSYNNEGGGSYGTRSYGSNNNGTYNNNYRSYNNNNNRSYNNNNRSYNNNNNDRGYGNNNGSSYNNNRGNSRPSYSNNNNNGNYRRSQDSRYSGGSGVKRIVKPVKYKENIDPNTPIRLNKYLANAGVCSRREADSYITAGVVKVNGEIINELGVKVKRGDLVSFHDQPVRLESKVYVLLNKPKNCVTTSDDPENRMTVMDLVKNACPERIYPVGRLDRNTTGVLLLTNDGDLASKLTHPKFKKKKIYQVTLDHDVAIEDMQAIADGVELDDGEIHADSIAYQSEDSLNVVGIEIHSGRNRIVRRIFEKLGYQVIKLDRVYFAGLTKKNIPRGKWRYLTEKEVNMLRMGAFE